MDCIAEISVVVIGMGIAAYISWVYRKKHDERFDHVFEEKREE